MLVSVGNYLNHVTQYHYMEINRPLRPIKIRRKFLDIRNWTYKEIDVPGDIDVSSYPENNVYIPFINHDFDPPKIQDVLLVMKNLPGNSTNNVYLVEKGEIKRHAYFEIDQLITTKYNYGYLEPEKEITVLNAIDARKPTSPTMIETPFVLVRKIKKTRDGKKFPNYKRRLESYYHKITRIVLPLVGIEITGAITGERVRELELKY